jgi:hypothetical protein
MKHVDKIRKLQKTTVCKKHPNITQSIGKGGRVVCRQCISDMKFARDLKKGKIQINYKKPKEILTPMGNKIK